jgi:hypothetical protein
MLAKNDATVRPYATKMQIHFIVCKEFTHTGCQDKLSYNDVQVLISRAGFF